MPAAHAPLAPSTPRWRGAVLVLALHGLMLCGWLLASQSREVEVQVQVQAPGLVMVQVAAQAPAGAREAAPAKPLGKLLRAAVPARMAPVPPLGAMPPKPVAEALPSTPTPAFTAASAAPVAAAAASAAHAAPRLTRTPQPLHGNPLPAYPEAAREDGLEGRVAMWVEVQADGQVGEVRWAQTSGTRLLDQAARDAVRRWRFAPALQAGEPVAGQLLLTLQFRLQGPVSWLAQADASR